MLEDNGPQKSGGVTKGDAPKNVDGFANPIGFSLTSAAKLLQEKHKPRGSYAVMAQRETSADGLDFFPTPPWATRALVQWLLQHGRDLQNATCWEPACGAGHMVRPLAEFFGRVYASDLADYGAGLVHDFFNPAVWDADWIITNPPFIAADAFARLAVRRAKTGVALLVRTSFLESVRRYNELFATTPPASILQFVERVPMVKGRLDPRASTATSYAWIVWFRGHKGSPEFHWIPPCRARLERDSDYQGDAR